jgi:ADP-heptose:LPS heptosyltransferase
MRIVALVPGGITDQILFFPSLESLHKAYPNAEIDVVVEPRAQDAYRLCKLVEEVIAFDYLDRNSPADWGNLLGVLRDRRYDAALSIANGPGIGLLLWLTGIPVRLSYAGGSGWFFTQTVATSPDQYTADYYHDLLKTLDIKATTPALSLSIPRADLDWADAEQKRLGLPGGGYVLFYGGLWELSPQTGSDRLYPVEKWQAIIQDFQNRQPNLPLVMVKGPQDGDLVAAMTKACPGLKVSAPANVGTLAALMAGADLVLSTDTAPMQVAVALDVYTVGLFGPTSPTRHLPSKDKFMGIQAPSGKLADLSPTSITEKIWATTGAS